jgi:predicted nucleic acid-binding protein
MVLADTSVWVDHLRKADPALSELLEEGEIVTHPFVTGELACGNLRNREEILGLLKSLGAVGLPDDTEILYFIEKHSLHGKGLGYVDVALLAACMMDEISLYTRDRRLGSAADNLGISHRR